MIGDVLGVFSGVLGSHQRYPDDRHRDIVHGACHGEIGRRRLCEVKLS